MQYEVEIRCLIPDPDREIQNLGLTIDKTAEYNQLNDYYVDGDIHQLAQNVQPVITKAQAKTLAEIIKNHNTFSVRARQNNDEVFFIVKATNGTSANHGVQRAEFEVPVAQTLDQLKDIITASGYTVQARWMAHRTLYRISNGITLNSYFCAGYGYGAEFELVVEAGQQANAETRVRDFAEQLGLEPVDPALMERMFAHYNAHWQEYYGTKKVFTLAAEE
jgi:adenylate cyclase class IV